MPDYLIEVKNLSKFFTLTKKHQSHTRALDDINLSVPKGCIYGIIGMSGAGKSTLLRCLTGLEKPSSGEFLFDGESFPYDNPKELRKIRRKLGMVFQHFQLFSSRNVLENIAYPLEISGIPAKERYQRASELCKLVGLENKQECYPSQLSGGEKQRVGIARALATNPDLLLCDEATSALDPKTTRDILHLLQNLNTQFGITLIMITHQLETIKQICDRVAVLSHGKVIEEGSVKDIFTRPKHSVTQHLVHLDADSLPNELLAKHEGSCLIRLGFEGSEATQPVISQLIRTCSVDVNILSGGLDYVQQTTIGHLFIELSGNEQEIAKALNFLQEHHVNCEVIR